MLRMGLLMMVVAGGVSAALAGSVERFVPVGARGRANNGPATAPAAPAVPAEKTTRQIAEEGMKVFKGSADGVLALAFSPDGKMVASACGDRSITLWDVETGQALKRWVGHKFAVSALSFSSDGKFLASGGFDSNIAIWDVRKGEIFKMLGEKGPVLRVHFLKDSRYVVSGYGKEVHIFDLEKNVMTINTCDGNVGDIAIGPRDEIIAVDHAGSMTVFDPKSGEVMAHYVRPQATRWAWNDVGPNFSTGVEMLADGKVMLSDVSGIWVHDLAKGSFELIGKNLYNLTGVTGVDGIYCGGKDNKAIWFRERSPEGVGLMIWQTFNIHAITVSADGQWVAFSGGGEHNARSEWRTAGPMDIYLLHAHSIQAALADEKRVKLGFLEANRKTDLKAVLDVTGITPLDGVPLPWKKGNAAP